MVSRKEFYSKVNGIQENEETVKVDQLLWSMHRIKSQKQKVTEERVCAIMLKKFGVRKDVALKQLELAVSTGYISKRITHKHPSYWPGPQLIKDAIDPGGCTLDDISNKICINYRLDPIPEFKDQVKSTIALMLGRSDLKKHGQLYKVPSVPKARDSELSSFKAKPIAVCSFCLGTAESNKDSEVEELISCHECGNSGHPSCLHYSPELVARIKLEPWLCLECKNCMICLQTGDDDRLLICDACDKGFHMDCMDPPVTFLPEGKWVCPECASPSKQSRKRASCGIGHTLTMLDENDFDGRKHKKMYNDDFQSTSNEMQSLHPLRHSPRDLSRQKTEQPNCLLINDIIHRTEKTNQQKEVAIQQKEGIIQKNNSIIKQKEAAVRPWYKRRNVKIIKQKKATNHQQQKAACEYEEKSLDKDEIIRRKEEIIQQKVATIRRKKKAAQQYEEKILEKKKTIQQNKKVIRQKEAIIEQKEATIQQNKVHYEKKISELETICREYEEVIQQKEAIIEQKEEKNKTIQEIEKTIQQKEITIQQNKKAAQQEIVALRNQLDSHPWMLQDEVEITDERIGGGVYSEVKVAIFRGTRVAAKCFHEIIVSRHNRAIVKREMGISSTIRHPNIVQFIGTITRVNSPILLYELMATSLYKRLQDDESLTHPQITGICCDIASALCYLHQWRPDPIIHRDVSSPNVLMEPLANNRWRAKLSDFGAANLQIHVKTIIPGNPAYSAPEAIVPQHHTPAMDVYSFGILATEMTLHTAPEMDITKREARSCTISWIPMKEIVLNCINTDPDQRPTSLQLLQALHEIADFFTQDD